jgi:2,4-dienoyl-CoA reductase-like NADH-dependent reductase (Old Yellow Enzyme family)
LTNEQKTNAHGYPHVFEALNLGPVTLSNRVMFPAWMLNYANEDGGVSEKLTKYYTDLAEGGCGLVMTGCAVVSTDGLPFNRVMRLDSDGYIPALKELFFAIKAKGAVAGIQIVHYGRQSSTSASGDVLQAPSAIPCPVMSQYDPEYKVKEMTLEDIGKMRDNFIDAAERAVKAGADVVEIHATHGYLLNGFMSAYSNKRTDEYGGSVEKRCRLVVEIIEGIGERLKGNSDYALSVRTNGFEFVEGGINAEDYETIVPLFEKAGIDMLNVSYGVYESMLNIVPPKANGSTPFVDITAKIKKFATVPVCAVGSILSVETAEQIIGAGKADMVAMGRAHHSDPAVVGKSKAGRESEIRKCIHCNSCTFWTTGDPESYCAVNPDYKKPKV